MNGCSIPSLMTRLGAFVVCFWQAGESVSTGRIIFSTKGVLDWSNIGRLVKLYTCESSPHHDAVIKGDNFVHISSGNQKVISSHLSSQISENVERNH